MMLPPETFEIPAAEMRRGYRSAIYFNRAKRIAAAHPDIDARGVTMQVFQKHDAVLCGISEAIALLKVGAGRWTDEHAAERVFDEYMVCKKSTRGAGREARYLATKQLRRLEDELDDMWESEFGDLTVLALNEAAKLEPWEPVLTIKGRYSAFAHLESVYLGVLARRTLVATNTKRVVEAANGKQVLFFADRFDHWSTQGGDGYAAFVGGATGFASEAMAAWWGDTATGTMPHALIAFFNGKTEDAVAAFHEEYPDTKLIALVDYANDCIGDALLCADQFGDSLYGVRLDTSENMVDQTIMDSTRMGDFKPTGVNPVLVEKMRDALDRDGYQHVKIVVSGGFTADKIRVFEHLSVPADAYAIGSSLLRGENDFTADIVEPSSKEGRWKRDDSRLSVVT